MTAITISSSVVPNYNGGGASATLKIFALKTFRTSDGILIMRQKPGGPVWYESVACTVSGTNLTIPAFILDSTTNSSVPSASYTGILYDANGLQKSILFSGWAVPHTLGTPITLVQWLDFNEIEPSPDVSWESYSAAQIEQLLSQKQNLIAGAENDFYQFKSGAWTNVPGGVRTTNVADLATSGTGTHADPYSGWDTPLAALITANLGHQTFWFPSGVYSHSATLDLGKYPHQHYKGERGTVLKYTGAGTAVLFEASIATTHSTIVGSGVGVFENFVIDGSSSGATGIKIAAYHASAFRNIAIRNFTGKALHLAHSIYNVFDNIFISSSVGNAVGDDPSTTQPQYGLYTELGSVSGAGSSQTNQANTFTNFIAENCSIAGGSLNAFHQNTFTSGSFEHNAINLVCVGNGNTWICTDNEDATGTEGYDWLIIGDYNQLINCMATEWLAIGEGVTGVIPVGNEIIGGQFGGIWIDPVAARTKVRSPQYNFTNSLGFFDGSDTTEYLGAPRNIQETTYNGWGVQTYHDAQFRRDATFPSTSYGPVLTSPDGTRYRIVAANGGALSTVAATAPLFDVANDAFTDNSLATRWHPGAYIISPVDQSDLVTIAESSGTLRFTIPNSTAGSFANGVVGPARVTADTGYERIKWVSQPSAGNHIFYFAIGRFSHKVALSSDHLRIWKSGSNLLYESVQGASGANIGTVAFNPATMIYWRFLRSGANIIGQWSTDGSAWNDLGTSSGVPWGTADDAYVVAIGAGQTASATYDAPVVFDDYVYFKGSYA